MKRHIASTTDQARTSLSIITNTIVAVFVLCAAPCSAIASEFLYTNNNEPYFGTSATVSAFTEESDGTLPMGYLWYRDFTVVQHVPSVFSPVSSLVLTNVQLTDAGIYRVVASNTVSHAPGVLSGGGDMVEQHAP